MSKINGFPKPYLISGTTNFWPTVIEMKHKQLECLQVRRGCPGSCARALFFKHERHTLQTKPVGFIPYNDLN